MLKTCAASRALERTDARADWTDGRYVGRTNKSTLAVGAVRANLQNRAAWHMFCGPNIEIQIPIKHFSFGFRAKSIILA